METTTKMNNSLYTFISRVKELIILLYNYALYLLANVIPKDKKLWVFGAWYGDKYADNPKYLFQYVNQYHPSIRAVWLSRNISIVTIVKSFGYESCYVYSRLGLFYSLRAGCAIYCQSLQVDMLPYMNTTKIIKIQLWHGIPLKKIGYDHKQYSTSKLSLKNTIFPYTLDSHTMMIAASSEDRRNFSSSFKMPLSKIHVTGYPRNDCIVSGNKKASILPTKILYMPTFRDLKLDEDAIFRQYNFDVRNISETLNRLNAKLFIKLHPAFNIDADLKSEIMNESGIELLSENDIYDTIIEYDILITDYSSIFFDYLLTDNPIIFSPFDLDRYMELNRKLYYAYDEVTPGPKCKNWTHVMEWIEIFLDDRNIYSDERKKVKNRFHQHQDSDSCRRVMESILSL